MASSDATQSLSAERPAVPARVARFEVRRLLGEGAFGCVYEAYDPQLERAVALKLAKPERLTSERRVGRFLREAKAVANLRHPHIVPVYDSGQDGSHYYIASAFVAGGTLEQRLAATPPDAREAAQLVRQLAEALAYAHSRGVVHRDVKPANALLDERGEPQLADFGLAARDAGEERLTQEGGWVGTPAYLAPEQAAGEAVAASDQYSLGCVLYELLTGQTPFEGPPELVVFLHSSQEPPAPRKVKAGVPRDLETIALKCLEKQPGRRYADCQALADDLRRWQEGEPITARRLSLAERAVRWVRREPRLAGAVGLAAVLLVGITGLSAWSAVTYQRLTLAAQKSEAEATRRFDQARSSVNDYLLEVEEDEALQSPLLRPVKQKLLRRGLGYYDDFLKTRGDDPKLRAANAEAVLRAAFIQQSLGNREAALAGYREAFPLFEALLAESPGERAYLLETARGYHRLGLLYAPDVNSRAEAKAALDKAVAILEPLAQAAGEDAGVLAALAGVYTSLGDWHKPVSGLEAGRYAGLALRTRERVAAVTPSEAGALRALADSHANLGALQVEARELKPALASYGRALAALEGTPEAGRDRGIAGQHARRLHDVGVIHLMMGDSGKSQETWGKALAERERLLYTLQPDLFADLARTSNDLGLVRVKVPAQREQGKALLEQALAMRSKVATHNPDTARYVYELVESLNNLGQFYIAAGDAATAQKLLQQGRGIVTRLPADQKKAANFAGLMAWNHSAAGLLHRKANEVEKALEAFKAALAIREELHRLQPGNAQVLGDLAINYMTLGNVLINAKRYSEAVPYNEKAVGMMEAQHLRNPDDLTRRGDYGVALDNLGYVQTLMGDPAAAVKTLEKAVAVQKVAVARSADRRYRVALASHYQRLAVGYRQLKDAEKSAAAAVARGGLFGEDPAVQFEVACDLAQCVPLAADAAARRYGDQALTHLERAVDRGFKDKARMGGPELAPIRGRAEFQALAKRLDSAGK